VGRELGLSVRRVARIERRGLRTLRRLGRTTGCAASPARPAASFGDANARTLLAAAHLGALSPHSPARTAPSATATSPSASPAARGGVLGAAAAQDPPAAVAPVVRPGGSDLTLAIMVVALAIAAGAGFVAVRSELR
jgi:hypothetical protein